MLYILHTGALLVKSATSTGWKVAINSQLDKDGKPVNTIGHENELFWSNAFEYTVSDPFDYFVAGV